MPGRRGAPAGSARRSLMMPDELWATVQREAAKETIHTGTYTSASELVRNAVQAYCNTSVDVRTSTEGEDGWDSGSALL